MKTSNVILLIALLFNVSLLKSSLELQSLKSQTISANQSQKKKHKLKKLQSQKVEAKKTESQKVQLQKTETQKAQVQKTELQKTEAQKTIVSKTELQKTIAQKTEVQKTETQKTDLQKSEVKKTEIKKNEEDQKNRFKSKKDDEPVVTHAGINSVPKEPPASLCNDLIATAGEVIPDLGNVRISTTAVIQFNIWRVLILGAAGDPSTVLYQYNFSDLDPEIKFIFNTQNCIVLNVKGEINHIGFCFPTRQIALQVAFSVDAFYHCRKNGGIIPSIDPNDLDSLLKFAKKAKAIPRPCKPGMKGCPPNVNDGIKIKPPIF